MLSVMVSIVLILWLNVHSWPPSHQGTLQSPLVGHIITVCKPVVSQPWRNYVTTANCLPEKTKPKTKQAYSHKHNAESISWGAALKLTLTFDLTGSKPALIKEAFFVFDSVSLGLDFIAYVLLPAVFSPGIEHLFMAQWGVQLRKWGWIAWHCDIQYVTAWWLFSKDFWDIHPHREESLQSHCVVRLFVYYYYRIDVYVGIYTLFTDCCCIKVAA